MNSTPPPPYRLPNSVAPGDYSGSFGRMQAWAYDPVAAVNSFAMVTGVLYAIEFRVVTGSGLVVPGNWWSNFFIAVPGDNSTANSGAAVYGPRTGFNASSPVPLLFQNYSVQTPLSTDISQDLIQGVTGYAVSLPFGPIAGASLNLAPPAMAPGIYYAAIWCHNTGTPPSLACATSSDVQANFQCDTAHRRFFTRAAPAGIVAPASITPTGTAPALWAGVSSA